MEGWVALCVLGAKGQEAALAEKTGSGFPGGRRASGSSLDGCAGFQQAGVGRGEAPRNGT